MVNPSDSSQRRRHAAALADLAPAELRRALKAQGFAENSLITRWRDVVGPAWAEDSMPLKLVFPPGEKRGGTLTVAIDGPLATEFRHLEPLILERIASVFGYRAVERIRLVHQDLAALRVARPRRPHAADVLPHGLDVEVATVERAGLKAALDSLGRWVAGGTD